MPIGTIINAVVVLIGGLIGAKFHEFIPKKVQHIVFQGIGLTVLLIGLQMALKVENILTLLFSVILGGVIGELFNLETRLEHFGLFLKSKFKSHDPLFVEGFVVNTMFACIGALAILGPINESLKGDRTILITKSIIDFFTALAFASSLGIGVAFSSISIFIYQGTITLLASFIQGIFTPFILAQLTAVGGLLIVGIGINLLEIKKIKITNLLPSLIFIVLFSLFFK